MKILLFSDTHLLKKFDEKKFAFLQRIISQADKVIILGDFWEGSLMTFDEFINSSWNKLFPLLKQKHTVYIYGNHDEETLSDNRVSLFSDVQSVRFTFNEGGKTFVVEHGDKFFDNHLIYQLTYGGPFKQIFMSKSFITLRFIILDDLLTKVFGKKFLNRRLSFNKHIKKVMLNEFKNGQILICGHTHAAEIDLKNNFINTGIIRHGLGQYVLIDDREVILKEEWYSKSSGRVE